MDSDKGNRVFAKGHNVPPPLVFSTKKAWFGNIFQKATLCPLRRTDVANAVRYLNHRVPLSEWTNFTCQGYPWCYKEKTGCIQRRQLSWWLSCAHASFLSRLNKCAKPILSTQDLGAAIRDRSMRRTGSLDCEHQIIAAPLPHPLPHPHSLSEGPSQKKSTIRSFMTGRAGKLGISKECGARVVCERDYCDERNLHVDGVTDYLEGQRDREIYWGGGGQEWLRMFIKTQTQRIFSVSASVRGADKLKQQDRGDEQSLADLRANSAQNIGQFDVTSGRQLNWSSARIRIVRWGLFVARRRRQRRFGSALTTDWNRHLTHRRELYGSCVSRCLVGKRPSRWEDENGGDEIKTSHSSWQVEWPSGIYCFAFVNTPSTNTGGCTLQ